MLACEEAQKNKRQHFMLACEEAQKNKCQHFMLACEEAQKNTFFSVDCYTFYSLIHFMFLKSYFKRSFSWYKNTHSYSCNV